MSTEIRVTNAEFVRAVFGDDWAHAHVASFSHPPDAIPKGESGRCWAGGWFEKTGISPGNNNYFTISTFHPSVENPDEVKDGAEPVIRARRRKGLFSKGHCIVVDDVGVKVLPDERLLPPSWRLETSPGNEQWGYILAGGGETSFEKVNGLVNAMIARGLSTDGTDPGMKGVTRYVRLPEGANRKRKYVETFGPGGFRCRMNEWEPARKYTIAQLADRFGISDEEIRHHAASGASRTRAAAAGGVESAADDPLLTELDALGMYIAPKLSEPGWHHVRCFNEKEHGEGRTDGAAVFVRADGSYGFECHHGHCKTLTGANLLNWFAHEHHDAYLRIRPQSRFPDLVAEEREERERARAKAIGEHGGLEPPTYKPRQMLIDEMLEEFVFIADGSRVAPRAAPQLVLSLSDMQRNMAGSFDLIAGANGRQRRSLRLDRWVEHAERLSVHTQTFAPGQGEFCWSPDGIPAQNLWLPREKRAFSPPAPDDWAERARAFFDHVAYLVPNPAERGRFLDWLAHIEQDPGTLPQTHYLLVARQTGIGRNWLSYTLARVWAGYVALGVDLADTLRSGFNGSLSRKVLACVDELHEAGGGPDAVRTGEKLKSMLTERTRLINPKFGRQHVEFNCCRFLMFSNFDAALPLADNDRRVVVIENPTDRRDDAYYSRLYGLIDDPLFIGSVIRALQARDITDFNPGAIAPMNAAKRAVVNAGRNDISQAMVDVAAEWPADLITAADLKAQITTITGIGGDKLGRIAGAAGHVGLRAYPGAVRFNGVATRVWILRNASRWSDAVHADVVAELKKSTSSPDSEDAKDLL